MTRVTPVLMVNNVQQTAQYYRDLLGFEVTDSVPGEKEDTLDFVIMQKENAELMFQSKESLGSDYAPFQQAPVGGSIVLYIEVESGLQQINDRIKSQVTIVQELHTTFYNMRELRFLDLNGYLVFLAEKV